MTVGIRAALKDHGWWRSQELKEQVARLKAMLGMLEEGSFSICERLDGAIRDTQTLQAFLEEHTTPILKRLED